MFVYVFVCCCAKDDAGPFTRSTTAAPSSQPPSKKPRMDKGFFGDLFSSATVAGHYEVNSYLGNLDTSDDMLAFWKVKAKNWPRLASIARVMLAIPATETSSKRVFSLAGRTIEDRRTQLNVDTIDDLIFLHGLQKD